MKDEYTKDGRLIIPKPAPSPEDVVVVSRSMSKELDWEKWIDERMVEGGIHPAYLKDFIRTLLTAKEDALRKAISEMKEATFPRLGYTGEKLVRDTALDEVLALLTPKN